MPLVILMMLLFITSWFFSEVLVLFPLSILNLVSIPHWLVMVGILLFFAWCFGE